MLESESELKTRYQTKNASDPGTNIDYFVIKKDNFNRVIKLNIYEKNVQFPEAVDHV